MLKSNVLFSLVMHGMATIAAPVHEEQSMMEFEQFQHTMEQKLERNWFPEIDVADPLATLRTLDDGLDTLRQMLQTAVEIEHATIPPYLAAYYSIQPGGANKDAATVIHSVAIEEMLHMASVANILNAVGGHPVLNTPEFPPIYPYNLPFINVTVDILPFTDFQVKMFRCIEEPRWTKLPETTYCSDPGLHVLSVYYARIISVMDALCLRYGEKAVFSGDPSLQVEVLGTSRGELHAVTTREAARHLMTYITIEGEGGILGDLDIITDTSPYSNEEEIPHYFRFHEICEGRFYTKSDQLLSTFHPTGALLDTNYSAVPIFKASPKAEDFKDYPDVFAKVTQFNVCYTNFLAALHDVFNGQPGNFGRTVGSMYQLGGLARSLVNTPDPRYPDEKLFVGMSWEWANVSATNVTCPF